jgi:hypothetical protein
MTQEQAEAIAREAANRLPGMRKGDALDYPDKSEMSIVGSGFEYTLSVSGQHVIRDGERTTTHTAQIMARCTSTRDSKGWQFSDRITGKHVLRMVDEDETSTSTTPFTRSHSGSVPGKEEAGKPIYVSKKLGVAHFSAPTWKVVNFPTTITNVYTNNMGTFTDTMKQEACFDIRIPDQASTQTAFAAAVKDIESKGNDVGMPLAGNVGPATFEVPWNGKSASGTFVVKVETLVSPQWINTNTFEANKFMRRGGEDTSAADTFPGTLTITWWIGARPPKAKLVLEPDEGYADWIPTPKEEQGVSFATPGFNGEPLDVTARIKPATEKEVQPSGRLDFYLTEVSKNQGRCCNFPRSFAADADLRFAEKQSDPSIKVDPADPSHAYTEKNVEEATVTIEALDTGAHGRLEVRCDDLSLTGEYKPTGNQYLSLPRDDDENQVADAWEKRALGDEAQPAEWDEDPDPAGQATTGDSISLYNEYRGFCVLGENGQRQFMRMNPKRKELFVIDKGKLLDTGAWGVASGMLAYKVDDSLVHGGGDRIASRQVDYNSDGDGHVYAVRIESIPGMVDPEDGTVDTTAGYVKPWPVTQPREVTHCYIFPARHRQFVKDAVKYLQRAVADPQGDEGQALQAAGIPPHLWQDALDRLDAATQEQLVQQMLRLTTIHELGHACAIPGHVEDSGEEGSSGNQQCPMRYTNTGDDLRFMVLQTIFKPGAALQGTYSSFCKDDDFDCWSHLSLRN